MLGSRCFNPRTREGCDKLPVEFLRDLGLFQSTHPRGVRLGDRVKFEGHTYVSIHAPARGATADAAAFFDKSYVSIHAPARGATSIYQIRWPYSSSFNPRTREGCDYWTQEDWLAL